MDVQLKVNGMKELFLEKDRLNGSPDRNMSEPFWKDSEKAKGLIGLLMEENGRDSGQTTYKMASDAISYLAESQ